MFKVSKTTALNYKSISQITLLLKFRSKIADDPEYRVKKAQNHQWHTYHSLRNTGTLVKHIKHYVLNMLCHLMHIHPI